MKKKPNNFVKQDKNSNYDIDGVSFDGEEIVVGSESGSTPEVEDQLKDRRKHPIRHDRKKNLDAKGTKI